MTVLFKLHCASVLPGGPGKYSESWAPAPETPTLQIWVRPRMRIFDKYDQVNVQKLACSPHSDWSTVNDQMGGLRGGGS